MGTADDLAAVLGPADARTEVEAAVGHGVASVTTEGRKRYCTSAELAIMAAPTARAMSARVVGRIRDRRRLFTWAPYTTPIGSL